MFELKKQMKSAKDGATDILPSQAFHVFWNNIFAKVMHQQEHMVVAFAMYILKAEVTIKFSLHKWLLVETLLKVTLDLLKKTITPCGEKNMMPGALLKLYKMCPN